MRMFRLKIHSRYISSKFLAVLRGVSGVILVLVLVLMKTPIQIPHFVEAYLTVMILNGNSNFPFGDYLCHDVDSSRLGFSDSERRTGTPST